MADVQPHEFNFEDNVVVYDWRLVRPLSVFGAEKGLGIMVRSTRFDNSHCTESVRVLAPSDAKEMGLSDPAMPVFFATISKDHTHGDLRKI